MTRVVGLTGGIGSGKSTVATLLRDLGAVVIDADAIVHEMQEAGEPLLAEMVAAFGPDILDANGALDREALGRIVFSDPAQRARLGAIVHPKVGAEMAHRLAAARASGAPLVVLDVPLLLEGREAGRGAPAPYECVIVVWAPEGAQLERQMRRDGRDRDEALRRIRSQMSLDEKRRLADHVIDNSGSPEETEQQVRALYQRLVTDTARPEPTPKGQTAC
ncbi:MAG: dephospho-CoA kinase [Deltaproteobacteria bacterium]|nr:dephospho-CoA kinase [Deltaproteobacteria bacterium]